MKIGVDLRALMTPNRTGVGEYTVELLNAIFNIDDKNQYYLFYNSSRDVSKHIPRWEKPNVHYVAMKWPNKLFNLSLKIFKYPKIDKSIIRNLKLGLRNLDYWFSPNLNFTALSNNIKHILTVHDLSFELFPEFFTLKQRLWHRLINPKKQCERADIILTPSENTKRDIVDYYKIDADKIKVLYPGVNCHFDRDSRRAEKSLDNRERDSSTMLGMTEKERQVIKKYNLPEKFILFLGAIEPRKNIIALIEAFEIYCQGVSSPPRGGIPFAGQYAPTRAQNIVPLQLIIAGAPGWKNKKIYDRANKSPVRDKIKFIGFVKPEEKPALTAAASLFVYPSFYEGFGFPVLEAMVADTPVIASNRASIPEITDSDAYLVNPNKPQEIAEGMKRLLNNKNLRDEQTKKTLLEAKKFDWKTTAEKWLQIVSSSN